MRTLNLCGKEATVASALQAPSPQDRVAFGPARRLPLSASSGAGREDADTAALRECTRGPRPDRLFRYLRPSTGFVMGLILPCLFCPRDQPQGSSIAGASAGQNMKRAPPSSAKRGTGFAQHQQNRLNRGSDFLHVRLHSDRRLAIDEQPRSNASAVFSARLWYEAGAVDRDKNSERLTTNQGKGEAWATSLMCSDRCFYTIV